MSTTADLESGGALRPHATASSHRLGRIEQSGPAMTDVVAAFVTYQALKRLERGLQALDDRMLVQNELRISKLKLWKLSKQ